jgi:hypothetical protein
MVKAVVGVTMEEAKGKKKLEFVFVGFFRRERFLNGGITFVDMWAT